MLLDKLIIKKNGKIQREIPFKVGVNLILDKSTKLDTETGNSVGKTTLLRVVDYCFGSNGKDIYTDSEFKESINIDVFNLAKDNNIYFFLDLIKPNGKPITIQRKFSVGKDEFMKIDEQEYTKPAVFRADLFSELFGCQETKPSLRQLMPRFVRSNTQRMSNTIKVLHQTTSIVEYEAICLFLLGFKEKSLFRDKAKSQKLLKKLKGQLAVYQTPHKLAALLQLMKVVDRDIEDLEAKLDKFELGEAYKHEMDTLKKMRIEISKLSSSVSALDIKIQNSELTIQRLDENLSDVDTDYIESIYEDANKYIGELHKSLETVVAFHNAMIENKSQFIKLQLVKLITKKNKLTGELNVLLNRESELFSSLNSKGSLSDLKVLQGQLNGLYGKKGEVEVSIKKIGEINDEIEDTELTQIGIDQKIDKFIDSFSENIEIFNSFFSKYSEYFYDEKFVLFYEKNKNNNFDFSVVNMEANAGSGKKKGQVASFDMAYISFLEQTKSRGPRFIMHDGIEEIHANQISAMFNLANEINGQYVVSVLKDTVSFMGENFIDTNKILELSESDKFFKI